MLELISALILIIRLAASPAAIYIGNGFGKLAGYSQVEAIPVDQILEILNQ
jgi:hypothetical protein